MLNTTNSIHHFVFGTSNSLTTSIWIIDERNSTPLTIDVQQSFVRIMWYRFLLIIIILITAAGNILVCLAIARERKLQNTTNYFLMSLAIADCLVAILVMPMGMMAEVLGHFPLPHYACIIFATMDVLCCTSSIWHMSTMSMDRYFTIRFPFRYGRNKTRRIMLLKIIAVWAISIAISSPVFVLGIVDKQNVLSNGICAPNNASFKLYGSVFAFYIPFIIMITTYALTMRSLRNVLVNKKKYSRERRRKQTFRPLAQIINQYAEIAQNIRRTSTSTTTNNNNQTPTSVMNNTPNSTKTPYTVVTTTATSSPTSPNDVRTPFFQTNNLETNLIQDSNNIQYGSINTNINNELIHQNNQHLTITYIKSSGSKKKRSQQQQQQQQQQATITINPQIINRTKNDCDMSTVYEVTEYSKSTSSSHDVTSITGNSITLKSIISNDQQKQEQEKTSEIIDDNNKEQKHMQNLTTTIQPLSTINTISPLQEEDDASLMIDIDSTSEKNDINSMEIISSLAYPIESICLAFPLEYYFFLIKYIIQYYLFIFPYRLRPLAIQTSINQNEKPLIVHQSTSTSSITPIIKRKSRSVSTQTNFLPAIELPNIQPIDNTTTMTTTTTTNIISNPPLPSHKRRRFLFNRPVLSSSSLITHIFRQSPPMISHSNAYSVKSSISLGQSSSSFPNRHQYPYYQQSAIVLRRTDSEMEQVLSDDHRPRASSSSSALLYTTNRPEKYWPRPLKRRQQYQSRSAYFLTNPNPYYSRRHQPFNSITNSSDSSSVFQRFNPRFLSTVSNHHHQQQQQTNAQRLRDEHIVAANERKALRVLMIIFSVFVTLWTPFFICTFISAICEQCRERISSTLWFSITWLGYSSSMANPFIYTIFSDVFRRAFINILCCRSNDSLLSRQISTKLSYQKGAAVHQYIHQQLSPRRTQNHENSGTSLPIPLNTPPPIIGENDATIYINRCASDSFR